MSNRSDPLELPQIIERPELQGRLRHGALTMLSIIGWAIWLYLFAPLITLLGWLFGYERLQAYALNNAEYSTYTLLVYVVLIAAAGTALLAWALYNLMRFRGKNRRGRLDAISETELAHAFRLPVDDVRRVHAAERTVLDYDEHGQITRITTR